MRTAPRQLSGRSIRGYTFTDMIVSVAAILLVAAVIVGPLTAFKRNARLARCTTNLRQIGQGLVGFTKDHDGVHPGMSPDQKGDLWWWYKDQIKRYVPAPSDTAAGDNQAFACPDDRGYTDPAPFHKTARFDFNSYVFNGVTLPGIPSIAGWKLSSIRQPTRTLLAMEWTAHAPLSWHKSRTGKKNWPFYSDAQSVVAFVDGHVALTRIYYDGFTAAYTRDPISGYDYRFSGN